MNLPNKLTVTRFVLVPIFFVSFLLWQKIPQVKVPALVIMLLAFIVAELTDLLDGKIARKHNLVTDLGKVMDPFADTLSHVTYFLCFVIYGIMPVWAFIIIMWREYAILFMRMLLAKFAGVTMPANIFGKSKTVLYAVSTVAAILFIAFKELAILPNILFIYSKVLLALFILSACASLMSFVIYLKDVLKSKALSGMTR